MKNTESRTKEILNWLGEVADQAPLFENMAMFRDTMGSLLSVLRAGNWREVHTGRRCMRLEVTYDYAAWERLMEQVEAALAAQPAAVEAKDAEIEALRADVETCPHLPPSAPVGVEGEPGAVRALVTAANAVLALYPHDDQLWSLESAVRPFNATRPAECSDGCPPQQVCDYCQIASLAQQPAAVELAARLVDELDGLVSESEGVSGLHLNGDVASWDELLPGGRFERLSSLDELREALAAQAQPKRRPYNASGSLSEYGVFPECDAQQPADDEVVFIDGVGAGRSSVKSCRDGVQWIVVGDRVYWPLSDSDAKRLQSACCGNGSFDDPAAALATHRKGGSDNG
jgi:hypothetical protein